MSFVDAAQFVFNWYRGDRWCFTRVCVRAPSGRQRWNVVGAIDAITHKRITVTNETSIPSADVWTLLGKIAVAHVEQCMTVVLDTARYQRCANVQACAQSWGIELLFLPPYSPNLNLIERLWGCVKDTCLYSAYYTTFTAFKQSITTCLNETNGKHAKQRQTLLTLKFQTFKNVNL